MYAMKLFTIRYDVASFSILHLVLPRLAKEGKSRLHRAVDSKADILAIR